MRHRADEELAVLLSSLLQPRAAVALESTTSTDYDVVVLDRSAVHATAAAGR